MENTHACRFYTRCENDKDVNCLFLYEYQDEECFTCKIIPESEEKDEK